MDQGNGDSWYEIRSHSKDKEGRRHRLLDIPPPDRCWDWLVISGDRHFAKNRSCFQEYRRIRGSAQGARVLGIGTVELLVRCNPTDESTVVLVLENVLHIPGAVCNGFSAQRMRQDMVCKGEKQQGLGRNESGGGTSTLWYATNFCGLKRLVLAGDVRGDSALSDERLVESGSALMISLHLDAEEEYQIIRQEVARLLFQAQRLQHLQLQGRNPSLELETSRFIRRRKEVFMEVVCWLHKKHPDRASLLASPSDCRLMDLVSPCIC